MKSIFQIYSILAHFHIEIILIFSTVISVSSFFCVYNIYLNKKSKKRTYLKMNKENFTNYKKLSGFKKNKRMKMNEKDSLALLTGIPVKTVYTWIRYERSKIKNREV